MRLPARRQPRVAGASSAGYLRRDRSRPARNRRRTCQEPRKRAGAAAPHELRVLRRGASGGRASRRAAHLHVAASQESCAKPDQRCWWRPACAPAWASSPRPVCLPSIAAASFAHLHCDASAAAAPQSSAKTRSRPPPMQRPARDHQMGSEKQGPQAPAPAQLLGGLLPAALHAFTGVLVLVLPRPAPPPHPPTTTQGHHRALAPQHVRLVRAGPHLPKKTFCRRDSTNNSTFRKKTAGRLDP